MKFILQAGDKEFSFSSLADAERAQEALRWLAPDNQTVVRKVSDPLAGWRPDYGDMFALQHFVDTNNLIPAIKFARMKSNAGLKESKDWVESNFR